MNIISFIGESHGSVGGYSTEKLLNRIKAGNPRRVIVTMDPDFKGRNDSYREVLNTILADSGISSSIQYANADETKFQELREEYFEKQTGNADALVKKNIMEMIETTIKSYLEGYWKDYDSVNSEVTDSLYRAMHKLISTMFWEVERDTWNAMLEEMTNKVEELNPGQGDVILVDVEKRYWLADKLEHKE